jgi:hypothetical protein
MPPTTKNRAHDPCRAGLARQLITRRKDGDLRYQEATISPVVDAGDAITQFIAVKRDDGAARRGGGTRTCACALLSDAVECIDEGLALFDADDRLLLHNRRFIAIPFLAERRELAGLRFEETGAAGLAAGAIGDPKALTDPRLDRRASAPASKSASAPRSAAGRRTLDRGEGAPHRRRRIVGVCDITDLQRREAATVEERTPPKSPTVPRRRSWPI